MNRYIVLIITIIMFVAATSFSGGNVGMSSQCINGACAVSVSSSLMSILFSLLLAIFVWTYKQEQTEIDNDSIVGIWRRIGAFLVDYIVVLMVLTPILTLPILILEFNYTGAFQWSFYREFSRATDNLVILPFVFIILACVIFYFYKYSTIERQTIGEYILNYKIIPLDRDMKPRYIKRIMLSSIGLCIWPISIIIALFNDGKQFWWDNASNTKAVKLKNS